MTEAKPKTLKLFFEVADATSILYGLIDECIEKFNIKNYGDITISHTVARMPNKFSLSYKIILSSRTVNKSTLCQASCELREQICRLKNFKNWAVVTNEDANMQMCEILYPKILDIETRLRAITNRIFMQFQGDQWSNELKIKTKQANNKRSSGFDLNQLTLGNLVNLLFRININENKSVPNNLDSLSKEELITIIHNIKCKTMWQHFFSTVELKIEYMDDLLDVRNNVMHFKPINYKYFTQNVVNCERINFCLKKVEKQIAGKKFSLSKEFMDALHLLTEIASKSNQTIVSSHARLIDVMPLVEKIIINPIYAKTLRQNYPTD